MAPGGRGPASPSDDHPRSVPPACARGRRHPGAGRSAGRRLLQARDPRGCLPVWRRAELSRRVSSASARRCYKNKPSGDAGDDAGGTCMRQELECSASPGPSGACDPVCQSGCACGEKCVNPGAGNMCTPIAMPVQLNYDSCNPAADRCRPGSVCLPEFQDRCGAHCYRFCRVDTDCGMNARCTGEAQDPAGNPLYRVCSARIEPCNPTGVAPACGPGAGADRLAPAFGCYILSHHAPRRDRLRVRRPAARRRGLRAGVPVRARPGVPEGRRPRPVAASCAPWRPAGCCRRWSARSASGACRS